MTYAVRIVRELEYPALEVPVEERAKDRRENRALRDANHLAVVLIANLNEVLCDMLFEKSDDFLPSRVGVYDLPRVNNQQWLQDRDVHGREPGPRKWYSAKHRRAAQRMRGSGGGRLSKQVDLMIRFSAMSLLLTFRHRLLDVLALNFLPCLVHSTISLDHVCILPESVNVFLRRNYSDHDTTNL